MDWTNPTSFHTEQFFFGKYFRFPKLLVSSQSHVQKKTFELAARIWFFNGLGNFADLRSDFIVGTKIL